MLVDVIVRNHEAVAAKPPQNLVDPPPIILVHTEVDNVLPVVKWNGHESYSWRERLENHVFGKLKGAALSEPFRIVSNNGGLDISGEYGSIDIEGKDFKVDSKLQNEMDRRYGSELSTTDLENKQRFKRLFR